MALAPVGDPRRPLQLAIRSTRLLGIVFTLLGMLVFAVPMLVRGAHSFGSILLIGVGLVYILPGILYIVFCIFLAQRQPWAIIATIVVAGLHSLIGLLALVGMLMQGNIIGIFICALWVAALGQMIYHLAKSFESMRSYQEYAPRGFDPLLQNQYQSPPAPPGE